MGIDSITLDDEQIRAAIGIVQHAITEPRLSFALKTYSMTPYLQVDATTGPLMSINDAEDDIKRRVYLFNWVEYHRRYGHSTSGHGVFPSDIRYDTPFMGRTKDGWSLYMRNDTSGKMVKTLKPFHNMRQAIADVYSSIHLSTPVEAMRYEIEFERVRKSLLLPYDYEWTHMDKIAVIREAGDNEEAIKSGIQGTYGMMFPPSQCLTMDFLEYRQTMRMKYYDFPNRMIPIPCAIIAVFNDDFARTRVDGRLPVSNGRDGYLHLEPFERWDTVAAFRKSDFDNGERMIRSSDSKMLYHFVGQAIANWCSHRSLRVVGTKDSWNGVMSMVERGNGLLCDVSTTESYEINEDDVNDMVYVVCHGSVKWRDASTRKLI